MSETNSQAPKVFISYSWSSQDHETWVLNLATELEQSGVHVILDKWELREGADKYAYMEKMVTDKTIRKVIVVCDRIYAEKADGRKGGVGTETQIISQEIYDQVDPLDQVQKFVAVITEKDDEGKPYIPTFLKSRIYIEMVDTETYADSFEQLLRWIFDKPLHQRPQRGIPPAYILNEEKVYLGTSSRHRAAIDAIKQNKPTAFGLVNDYFETFAKNLETLRIEPLKDKEFDDQVVESIEAFLPYRDEALELIMVIARFKPDVEMHQAIHRFFELILPYGFKPSHISSWREADFDNFRFILNELFLFTIAALIKVGNFAGVQCLVEQSYYLPNFSSDRPQLVTFVMFRGYLESFEYRNKRLNSRRLSLMSDFLKERTTLPDLTFEDIMQADFILYLRNILDPPNSLRGWFPHTLLYAVERWHPFELFVRAQSKRYFDRLIGILGVATKDDIDEAIKKLLNDSIQRVPRWDYTNLDIRRLMNFENIATLP